MEKQKGRNESRRHKEIWKQRELGGKEIKPSREEANKNPCVKPFQKRVSFM